MPKEPHENKILLVEDEESLAKGLVFNLRADGFQVDWVTDGKQALEAFHSKEYSLIILDIMLPYLDGFEVAEHIREKDARIPILMLTARTETKDRIKGLQLGADDYLPKPFHLEELLLRVRRMLKRKDWYKNDTETPAVIRFGNNEVNFENLHCKAGEKEFQLTAREAILLRYLVKNKGRVVSRKELLEEVWDMGSGVETRTVDNFIVRLRKYFEPDPSHPIYIKSIRSIGYMFNEE